MHKGESEWQRQHPRRKEATFPQGKHNSNDRNANCRSLLDTGKGKGVAAGCKKQKIVNE